jgi:hypothetical protein
MPPSGNALALEQVPKKLTGFFDKNMLQLFDFERVLTDQKIPFDRDALYASFPPRLGVKALPFRSPS